MNVSSLIKGRNWQARKFGDNYIFSIDVGGKIIASLEDFVRCENIGAAEITGIGATNDVTLAFYNPTTKVFDMKTFKEQMEIANATGNVAYKKDELYVHLHVTLGREDYSSYAGHLVEATIHGAAEFFIKTYPYKTIKNRVGNTEMWLYNLEE